MIWYRRWHIKRNTALEYLGPIKFLMVPSCPYVSVTLCAYSFSAAFFSDCGSSSCSSASAPLASDSSPDGGSSAAGSLVTLAPVVSTAWTDFPFDSVLEVGFGGIVAEVTSSSSDSSMIFRRFLAGSDGELFVSLALEPFCPDFCGCSVLLPPSFCASSELVFFLHEIYP
jgi:hypothetical protein